MAKKDWRIHLPVGPAVCRIEELTILLRLRESIDCPASRRAKRLNPIDIPGRA